MSEIMYNLWPPAGMQQSTSSLSTGVKPDICFFRHQRLCRPELWKPCPKIWKRIITPTTDWLFSFRIFFSQENNEFCLAKSHWTGNLEIWWHNQSREYRGNSAARFLRRFSVPTYEETTSQSIIEKQGPSTTSDASSWFARGPTRKLYCNYLSRIVD